MDTVYLEEPDMRVQHDRHFADACLICGSKEPACTCRYCRSCSRYWVAPVALVRDVDLGREDGVKRATCKPCVEAGF